MTIEKQYEILKGLPPYGPMYIPVTDNGDPFYSEGYVVKFYKSDGTDWVANFRPGWTNYYKVFDFPERKTVVVIAGGLGYVMTPDQEKPKFCFGRHTINEVIQTNNGSLICSDIININILDNTTGELWRSERISWDGIKDLKLVDDVVYGKTCDPTNSKQEWCDFSLNLKTKEIKGGSYREFLRINPNP